MEEPSFSGLEEKLELLGRHRDFGRRRCREFLDDISALASEQADVMGSRSLACRSQTLPSSTSNTASADTLRNSTSIDIAQADLASTSFRPCLHIDIPETPSTGHPKSGTFPSHHKTLSLEQLRSSRRMQTTRKATSSTETWHHSQVLEGSFGNPVNPSPDSQCFQYPRSPCSLPSSDGFRSATANLQFPKSPHSVAVTAELKDLESDSPPSTSQSSCAAVKSQPKKPLRVRRVRHSTGCLDGSVPWHELPAPTSPMEAPKGPNFLPLPEHRRSRRKSPRVACSADTTHRWEARGAQSQPRRVPGSGCRLPLELTYFDWPEEIDSLGLQGHGGASCDARFANLLADRAMRSSPCGLTGGSGQGDGFSAESDNSQGSAADQGSDVEIPRRQSFGSDTTSSLTSKHSRDACSGNLRADTSSAGLGSDGLAEDEHDSLGLSWTEMCSAASSLRGRGVHVRRSSESAASATTGTCDTGTSNSSSSSTASASQRRRAQSAGSFKEWMRSCPVANAAQIAMARKAKSRLPVIFSDCTPSEGCTSSASECDSALKTRMAKLGCTTHPGAGALKSPDVLSYKLQSLSPLKQGSSHQEKAPEGAAVPTSEHATRAACTSIPSEVEEIALTARVVQHDHPCSTRLQEPIRLPLQAISSELQKHPAPLNAAQMILARKAHCSPLTGTAPLVFSDYATSEGCTSSASECEQKVRMSMAQ